MSNDGGKQGEEYYYYATEGVLGALWSNEIKISAPCDFNDPMEFLPATGKLTEENRKICLAWQASSRNNIYVLCLSARKNNPRMWAQYGGNHTGIMLTVDFSKGLYSDWKKVGLLGPVDYSKRERYLLNVGDSPNVDDLRALLYRKGKDWEHEEEWRLVIPETALKALGGHYGMLSGQVAAFLPLPDENISTVTVGHRSSATLFDSVLKIREIRNAAWRVCKAKLSDTEFTLVEDEWRVTSVKNR